MKQVNYDKAIVATIAKHGEIAQNEVVRELLPIVSEPQIYSRVRHLMAQGYITKTESGHGNIKVLKLTTAGKCLAGVQ